MRFVRVPLLLWLLFFAAAASAQEFPKLSGRVVDAANLLSPQQEAELSGKLQALESRSTRQLVVATIPDLGGFPIEDYGYRLGRAWGLGQGKANNGAILIVAPKERKVRIEVGYGLEPILTDALSSLIIQTAIVPRFKQGDMAGGIIAGTDAVVDQLQAPPEEAEKNVQAATGARAQRGQSSGPAIFPLIFWGVVLLIVLLSLVGRHRRQGAYRARRYGDGGSAWPIVLWTLANELDRGSHGGRSGGGFDWGGGGFGGGWGGGGGGGFSGGGGSFGGGGASGRW